MTSSLGHNHYTSTPFRMSFLAALIAAACTGTAVAQTTEAETKDADASVETIEVRGSATGTLIRGATPVGTNVVSLGSEDITAIGVPDSNELLAQIPQVTNTFNSRPTINTDIGQGMPMPKLRDIGTGGGSTTLLLLNGMRLPGSGLIQTVPNASAIPPAMIRNLEIVMDGGSSTYGSDAIAGVINFITKRPEEGVSLDVEGGFGDSFTSGTVNLSVGTAWGSGAATISLYHAQNSDVMGRDRDFITADNTANGGSDYRSRLCNPGNITVEGTSYQMDTRTLGSNLCDQNDGISYVPEETKDTVFLSLDQDFSDNMFFNLVTYYSEWNIDITGDATNAVTDLGASGTITDSNPYFSAIGNETSQFVEFDFSDVAGSGASNGNDFSAFSFMPELTIELPNYWRMRTSYSYGLAKTEGHESGINSSLVTQALAATDADSALNPYDVSQTNAAVLDDILAYYGTYGDATQSHHQLRVTLDGAAFNLPAGDVMLAVGAEYFKQNYEVVFGGGPAGALTLNEADTSRNVKSFFGEVVVPLLDSSAGVVNMTASARYDDYNDVGSTTNPKVGVDYSPTDNLRIRAQWGTSFQAPSLADSGSAVDTRAITFANSPWRAADSGNDDFNRGTILLAGGNDGLNPEESESYSVGFDWTPEQLEDFKLSLTYFNVDYSSAISFANIFAPSTYYTVDAYQSFYTLNPTLEQAQALTEGFRIDGAPVSSLYEDGKSVYVIADARRNNMAATKLSGIDFDIKKTWSTDFGSVNAGLAGSYTLDRKYQPVEGSQYIDQMDNGTYGDFNAVASLGTTIDEFSGNVRVLHSDGWENDSASLDSLTTINLFASYNLGSNDYFEETQVTLNIDNVLDKDALYFDDVNGFGGGAVLGRVFYLGFNVRM